MGEAFKRGSSIVKPIFAVGLGSALGGLARFGMDLCCLSVLGMDLYAVLFIVNILGSFLIGLCVIHSQGGLSKEPSLYWYFWGVGFCGGFTTFASFVFVLSKGIFEANVLAMALYGSFSIVIALIALVFGLIVGQKNLKRYNLGSGGSE